MSRRRRVRQMAYRDIELNIMPFIDMFSMLNTFLLYTAAFIALGIIEVQIPFLSNAAPPTKETREFKVTVDVVSGDKVEVVTSFSAAPINEQKWDYALTDQGLSEMHARLLSIRRDHVETDKVNVFSDDDVTFEKLAKVLDAIKMRRQGEPAFQTREEKEKNLPVSDFLYPKIVMGSVILKGG